MQDPEYCSACGTDIKIYQKLIRLSNTYYNMGLEKARVRNLSGAVQDLKNSLKLNKEHISARNLLGLIYYETGEVVSALTEWIISKNLEPNKNIADEYIRAIQNNPARLETINQTIKKYNQSLLYCQQGSDDLAVIQLKKVLSLNPKLVKAHQLLALLYIQSEEYDRAGRELQRALAIDKTDNLSLRYLEELEQRTGAPVGSGKKPEREGKERGKNPDVISYTSGNETIIMPSTYKDNTGVNVVLNLLIGLVAGWIANLIVKGRGGGLVVNIIVGIVGSLLGGWIFSLFGLFAMGTAGSLITAIVGAIILLWIVSLLSTKKTSKV